jgi:hypothetical protein
MLIYDLVPPQDLLGYVRELQIEQERNKFVLAAYLPNDNIDEIEYRITQGNLRDVDVAKVRAWDTETSVGSRQGLKRLIGELPPIGRKIRLGEEERLRKRKLETGSTAALEAAIYDDAAKMARAVLGRTEMLRGELLQLGTITINENGVSTGTISFNRAGAHNVTAATKWDQAGATPIADLKSWVQTYINTNGIMPALSLTSTAVITQLMLSTEIRQLATSITGVPSMVTLQAVQTVFAAFGLPPLVPYDVNVRVDGTATRVTNSKMLTLLPPADEPLGATFFGTTAEALDLAEVNQIASDQAPGLVATISREDDPVSTWTKAAAIVLPVFANPDLTLNATVLT